MRIYSMTATFGKLEHQHLTLTPGLNVIDAPNEWGKSTWCAFLTAMLYGIDTKERTKQGVLAEKERYKPWSGAPMSGSMDIHWNGRDITIQRTTKGRGIMGEFSAFETGSGLPVPELTATNCGQLLLGVEKSVFARSAFIRQADLPVDNDDALRRRLNALVTTGDESNTSDDLAHKLRDLKNSCRHNKTGQLPQAEAQRDSILQKLHRLEELQTQCTDLQQKQSDLQTQRKALENHQCALAYQVAQEDRLRIDAANKAKKEADAVRKQAAFICQSLPSKQEAEETLKQLEALQQQWDSLQNDVMPTLPDMLQVPAPFLGLTPEQAVQQAKCDYSAFQMLQKPLSPMFLILAVLFAVIGIALSLLIKWYLLLPMAVLTVIFYLSHRRSKKHQVRDRKDICSRYGSLSPEQWLPLAESYREKEAAFRKENALYQAQTGQQIQKRQELSAQTATLTQGQPLSSCLASWKHILAQYAALEQSERAFQQAEHHAQALAAMAKPVQPPAFADNLTLPLPQTQEAISQVAVQLRQLDLNLGQCRGQMEALGQKTRLQQQLSAIEARIERLEDIYSALSIALATLEKAANELQRRFAPKLAKQAQTLFQKLTGGRYTRLNLGQDMSLSAATEQDDIFHSSLWCSDGTADQLYLALRLAVARELTPEAPLVLDDVFVRFDDTRLSLAMEILQEEANSKQVIVFTCQGRENEYLLHHD